MFYIYGTAEQRKHFTDTNNIPYFRYEEQQDQNCVCLYNDDDDKAAMIVELMFGFFEVLEMRDGESVDSWQFSGYDEALEKYNELND